MFCLIHTDRETGKMRSQRNMFQTKEQGKSLARDLNKTEISNPPDKKFRVMVKKMLTDLRRVNGHKRELQQRDRKHKKLPNGSYNRNETIL